MTYDGLCTLHGPFCHHLANELPQGANIKLIQAQLGHASIKTTLDRYGHLLPEVWNGVGVQLDAQVFESIPKFAKAAAAG